MLVHATQRRRADDVASMPQFSDLQQPRLQARKWAACRAPD